MTAGVAPRTGRLPTLAKYDVLEELGHGGMATVYRAKDKRLGRDVAIKVIHPHLRDSREVAHRFHVEAQAVAKLRHVNIVEVYDVSSEGETEQYLVVELLRGRTLRKLLQAHGALPPEVAAAIGVELLGALAHAHASGVIHRDIKPENVIIEHRPPPEAALQQTSINGGAPSREVPSTEQPGDRVLVKLTDFGIAKLLDAQGMTSTGQVLGSPAHMAPEQIEGGDVDGRADVFGLGVLLYECMVGHLPFEGNNPAQVLRRVLDGIYPSAEHEQPTVGKAWSLILDRALARRAEDRFASAPAMRDALLDELKRLDVTTPRAELEAWADDPDGYAARHQKRMIACLCERAAQARRRGDAISAAADYNRALAYAPHDPALLRIVGSMHRAEQRRRLLARVAPLCAGALGMGAVAFVVTRALHSHERHDPPPPASASASASAAPSALPPLASASASARPPASVSAPILPTNVVKTQPAQTKPQTRTITFTEVHPSGGGGGVFVSVDNEIAKKIGRGSTVEVDTKPHTLVFSCPEDPTDHTPLCDPVTRAVAAGDGDSTMTVRLNLKPALLFIDGDGSRSYRIEEFPGLPPLRVGAVNSIPLTDNASVPVHVFEVETGQEQPVNLFSGKRRNVTFAP